MNKNLIVGRGVIPGLMTYSALLFDVLSKRGMSISDFLKGSDVAPEDLAMSEVYIGDQSANIIVENALDYADDVFTLAWEFAKALSVSQHGSLGHAVNASSSIADAFETISSYMMIQVPNCLVESLLEDNMVGLKLVDAIDGHSPRDSNKQVMVFSLLTFFYTIDIIGRTRLVSQLKNMASMPSLEDTKSTIYLNVPLMQPNNIPEHIELVFDAPESKIMWPVYILDFPTATPDKQFIEAARKQCEAKLTDIRQLVYSSKEGVVYKVSAYLSRQEQPSLEATAEYLHMSPRTLKRRLKQEGTSFIAIKNNVRFYQASNLLLSNKRLTVEEIACELGFSSGSNFIKAFKKWSGETPKAYKNSQTRT